MKRYHAFLLAAAIWGALRVLTLIEPCDDSSGHSCTAAERSRR